jgi:predicted transcriptional regulator
MEKVRKDKIASAWVDPWMFDALVSIARKDERSISWVVKQAIKEYLKSQGVTNGQTG